METINGINNNTFLDLLSNYNDHIRRQQNIVEETLSLIRTVNNTMNDNIRSVLTTLEQTQNNISTYGSILQSVNRRLETRRIPDNDSVTATPQSSTAPITSSRRNYMYPISSDLYRNILRNRNRYSASPNRNYLTILNPLLQYSLRSSRLSQEEFAEITEQLVYEENMNETRCPISWEDFTPGESIVRIRQCGHIFKPASLESWLRLNTHCPVCRCNLERINRNSDTNDSSLGRETTESDNNDVGENNENDETDSVEDIAVDMSNNNTNITSTNPYSHLERRSRSRSGYTFLEALDHILQNIDGGNRTSTGITTDMSGSTLVAEYVIQIDE